MTHSDTSTQLYDFVFQFAFFVLRSSLFVIVIFLLLLVHVLIGFPLCLQNSKTHGKTPTHMQTNTCPINDILTIPWTK